MDRLQTKKRLRKLSDNIDKPAKRQKLDAESVVLPKKVCRSNYQTQESCSPKKPTTVKKFMEFTKQHSSNLPQFFAQDRVFLAIEQHKDYSKEQKYLAMLSWNEQSFFYS